MFGFFKSKKAPARELTHPKQLLTGDLLSFKPRSILPPELQGQTVTIKNVQSYQYSEGLTPEFEAQLAGGQTFTFMLAEEDDALTLSKEISREEVEQLFDMEQFSELFGDEFPTLTTNSANASEALSLWLAPQYNQAIKNATAYFYKTDKRASGVSAYEDDSEELRYHECEGTPDDFSINIEIWEDGTTQVFLQKTVPFNVIEEMWPNGW